GRRHNFFSTWPHMRGPMRLRAVELYTMLKSRGCRLGLGQTNPEKPSSKEMRSLSARSQCSTALRGRTTSTSWCGSARSDTSSQVRRLHLRFLQPEPHVHTLDRIVPLHGSLLGTGDTSCRTSPKAVGSVCCRIRPLSLGSR